MVTLRIIHHWTYCKDSSLNDCSYKTCQIVDIRVGHSLHYEILKMKIIIINSNSWKVILFSSLRLHIRKRVSERLGALSSFMTKKLQRFFFFYSRFDALFITTQHTSLRSKSVSEMPNIPFSLPTFHLRETLPHSSLWEGQHYTPCDCAPPISVTDPRIDI